MRVIYASGVLLALGELGLTQSFDHVLGVSAGSPVCAYFLSHQHQVGLSFFYDDLSGTRFINRKRPWRMVDIDYLMERMRHGKPLDVRALRASRSQFRVAVTRADTGAGELLDVQDEAVDPVSAIGASCAIPILYNRTVSICGTEYADGGVGFGLPLGYVVDRLGCTDILVVLNRPYSDDEPAPSRAQRLAMFLACRGFSLSFRRAVITRHHHYNRAATVIQGVRRAGRPVTISVIAPEQLPVTRVTTEKARLRLAAEQGIRDGMGFFGLEGEADEASSRLLTWSLDQQPAWP